MSTVVVFDCESDGAPTCGDFKRVQCTCACAIVIQSKDALQACSDPSLVEQLMSASETVSTRITCWRDISEMGLDPFYNLLLAFDQAEAIVAHNGLDFDFPLLRKHYGYSVAANGRYMSHRLKCLDCFSRLRSITGGWISLNTLLANNHLSSKTGDGKEAIQWWYNGNRTKLRAYCFKDVELTARLCLLPRMHLPGLGNVPLSIYNIAPFLASLRCDLRIPEDSDWLVVKSPESASGGSSAGSDCV